MEHPFFATNATPTRAEAQRWLTIAEKLLSTRDLMGSKSFASRAHDSDPTLSQADQILAVADTLLAGDIRIGNNNHDWYSILRITPAQGRDSDFVATQYRNLALLLNPQTNNFAFADQAFRLVIEAWSVLSNPSRKNMYDSELAFLAQQEQQQQHDPFGNNNGTMPLNFMLFGNNSSSNVASNSNVHVGSSSGGGGGQVQFGQMPVPQNFMNFGSVSNVGFGSGSNNLNAEAFFSGGGGGGGNVSYADGTDQEQVNVNMQPERQDNNRNVNVGGSVGNEGGNEREEGEDERENDNGGSTFWTACPYCYHMFEFPKMYVDCCLKCEICKRAFQGVVIPSPPPVKDGDKNFCCFGFMPLGFSSEEWEKNESAVPAWSPFSPLFATPKVEKKRRGGPRNWGPRVYFDDDDTIVDLSDSDDSDDGDWRNYGKSTGKSTKRKANGKGSSGTAYKSRKKSQVDKGKHVRVQDGGFPANNVEMLNKKTVESSEKGPTPNNATGEPSKKDLAPHQTTGGPIKKSGSGATPNTIARKQPVRGAKSYSRLDLNMECNNEAEEPAIRMNPGNGLGRREDENVEGIGFFEGLDEFLSNLPILNAVDEDKAIKA